MPSLPDHAWEHQLKVLNRRIESLERTRRLQMVSSIGLVLLLALIALLSVAVAR